MRKRKGKGKPLHAKSSRKETINARMGEGFFLQARRSRNGGGRCCGLKYTGAEEMAARKKSDMSGCDLGLEKGQGARTSHT